MKLIIDKKQLSHNHTYWLQRIAGYIYFPGRKSGQASFIRPLQGRGYPRFHLYVEDEVETIVLNLHLDQKEASYANSAAHSGEYDSPVVVNEINRLKSLIQ